MPIIIDKDLPARKVLQEENIFVMTKERAETQDIRALKIAILNLMPTKQETEAQLLRLIGNTPLQLDVHLLHMESHLSRNVAQEHLTSFYKTFRDIENEKFDGLIITGAPVETLSFEEVDYWEELKRIMEYSKNECNIYASYLLGGHRLVCIIIMAFQSILLRKKCLVYLNMKSVSNM